MAPVDDPPRDPGTGPSTLDEHRGERRSLSERADEVIKSHMTFSMMGGAIPIPLLDLAALTAVQLDMIRQLALLYDVPFDGHASRSFLTSLASALAGKTLARLAGASLAKLIPGVGTLAGAAASSYLNGAFTYATGSVVKAHFAQGRTLDQLDFGRIKGEFGRLFEVGRQYAADQLAKVRGPKGTGKAPGDAPGEGPGSGQGGAT